MSKDVRDQMKSINKSSSRSGVVKNRVDSIQKRNSQESISSGVNEQNKSIRNGFVSSQWQQNQGSDYKKIKPVSNVSTKTDLMTVGTGHCSDSLGQGQDNKTYKEKRDLNNHEIGRVSRLVEQFEGMKRALMPTQDSLDRLKTSQDNKVSQQKDNLNDHKTGKVRHIVEQFHIMKSELESKASKVDNLEKSQVSQTFCNRSGIFYARPVQVQVIASPQETESDVSPVKYSR